MDSISRRGVTFINARKYIEKNLQDKNVKYALLFAGENISDNQVDYVIERRDASKIVFPYQYTIL